ncbi:Golgi Transport [Thecaphora frezii]
MGFLHPGAGLLGFWVFSTPSTGVDVSVRHPSYPLAYHAPLLPPSPAPTTAFLAQHRSPSLASASHTPRRFRSSLQRRAVLFSSNYLPRRAYSKGTAMWLTDQQSEFSFPLLCSFSFLLGKPPLPPLIHPPPPPPLSLSPSLSLPLPLSPSLPLSPPLRLFWQPALAEIGVGLVSFGSFFLMMGVVLFFDAALLALGNVLFTAGITLLIGPQKTFYFFARKQKMRGTICFFTGMMMVFCKWAVVGMLVEAFGFLNLFGDFFPVILNFLRQLPGIGNVLSLPYIRDVLDRLAGSRTSAV